jgi:hypothetical protein
MTGCEGAICRLRPPFIRNTPLEGTRFIRIRSRRLPNNLYAEQNRRRWLPSGSLLWCLLLPSLPLRLRRSLHQCLPLSLPEASGNTTMYFCRVCIRCIMDSGNAIRTTAAIGD